MKGTKVQTLSVVHTYPCILMYVKIESHATVTGGSPWIYLTNGITDTQLCTFDHLYIKVSLIVIHECSRTAIQDTLKPWCLGSYADLAYSSYSDAQASILTHIVITKRTEAELATVSGCMHAYQSSFMHNVSIYVAFTLVQLA